DCLRPSPVIDRPNSVDDAVREKYRLAAALKAQQAREDWMRTDTAWYTRDPYRSGAFEFSYDYQRADLAVRGPAVYGGDGARVIDAYRHTLYPGSGLRASAGTLGALPGPCDACDVSLPPRSYAQTRARGPHL